MAKLVEIIGVTHNRVIATAFRHLPCRASMLFSYFAFIREPQFGKPSFGHGIKKVGADAGGETEQGAVIAAGVKVLMRRLRSLYVKQAAFFPGHLFFIDIGMAFTLKDVKPCAKRDFLLYGSRQMQR